MNLWTYFQTNRGSLINKWKHYFPIYERYFKEFVYKPVTFMEIGVYHGGSLQMWKHYFGPYARIIGIDILPKCKEFEEDQVSIRIGRQQDREFMQSVLDEFGPPDIVLDDGSHMMSDIGATFRFLYPQIAKNGIYVVEDLQTCYWEEFQGGFRKPTTFVETCKDLIDELNADHTRGALTPTEFTNSTISIHFYDGVVVFERGVHTKKMAVEIGRRTLHAWDTIPTRISRRIETRYRPWTRAERGEPLRSGKFLVRLSDGTESKALYDLTERRWQINREDWAGLTVEQWKEL